MGPVQSRTHRHCHYVSTRNSGRYEKGRGRTGTLRLQSAAGRERVQRGHVSYIGFWVWLSPTLRVLLLCPKLRESGISQSVVPADHATSSSFPLAPTVAAVAAP